MQDLTYQKASSKANLPRYPDINSNGHYESFFIRANHPEEPKAFWIRFTSFCPADRQSNKLQSYPIGEIWVMAFDGETGDHFAAREVISHEKVNIDPGSCSLKFAKSFFQDFASRGEVKMSDSSNIHHEANWELNWDESFNRSSDTVFLLPLSAYSLPFPKAKSLVPRPQVTFSGKITFNGKSWTIKNWPGSQNHNWGERHTDTYAWGQVCGFDNEKDAFLEVASARLKIGPIDTPFLTPIVLRYRNEEFKINVWLGLTSPEVDLEYFNWKFKAENSNFKIEGRISAKDSDFVGLTYLNPPGGTKICLNSKIASCTLSLTEKNRAGRVIHLSSKNGAAFEILTDDRNSGVPIRF